MIKIMVLVAGVGITGLLIAAAARPKTFGVQRSISIQAGAKRIYPLMIDLRRFNSWNPYAKKAPDMKTAYHGPASGRGASFDFHGNKQASTGSIRIVDATEPSNVAMKLDMSVPFECHNDIAFSLAPKGDATEVTWTMHGPSPFLARLAGLFMNMDKIIGRDFETGLADLKALAERK